MCCSEERISSTCYHFNLVIVRKALKSPIMSCPNWSAIEQFSHVHYKAICFGPLAVHILEVLDKQPGAESALSVHKCIISQQHEMRKHRGVVIRKCCIMVFVRLVSFSGRNMVLSEGGPLSRCNRRLQMSPNFI